MGRGVAVHRRRAGAGMTIRRAASTAIDPAEAVAELAAGLAQPDPEIVVFFCSAGFDLDALAEALRAAFGTTTVVGCTTAGEITPLGYAEGSITGFSLGRSCCRAATALMPDISDFEIAAGRSAAEGVMADLAARSQDLPGAGTFAMLLIDGLSVHEEAVLSAIGSRIADVPLVGGSAGDDLRFGRSFIYHGGRFHGDAALLAGISLTHPFRPFKCQHFTGSGTRMVVTAADVHRRTVYEIDAEPAAREYARLIGRDPAALTPEAFADHPVMVKVGGDYHVRSIQRVNPDGSLTFYCAIDEGVVLTLSRREDIVANLDAFFAGVRAAMGEPQLTLGFDCVLRRVEARNLQVVRQIDAILSDNKVVGFCTYGEQFGVMHFNQTFTGVVIGAAPDGEG